MQKPNYKPGEAFLIPSDHKTEDRRLATKHLHVIVADIEHQCLLVNLSTVHGARGEDLTVVLKGGDHKRILVPSYVNYEEAYIELKTRLRQAINEAGSTTIRVENVSSAVLTKVQAGLLQSPMTPDQEREFFGMWQSVMQRAQQISRDDGNER